MDHHLVHPEDIPASYRDNDADRVVQATDYIAGMTDRYALLTHERLFGDDGMGDAGPVSHRGGVFSDLLPGIRVGHRHGRGAG